MACAGSAGLGFQTHVLYWQPNILFRRIEDKFLSMGMELKNCSILFNLDNIHGNRHLTQGNSTVLFIWELLIMFHYVILFGAWISLSGALPKRSPLGWS